MIVSFSTHLLLGIIGRSKGDAMEVCPQTTFFFHFHAVFGKNNNIHNNRLAAPSSWTFLGKLVKTVVCPPPPGLVHPLGNLESVTLHGGCFPVNICTLNGQFLLITLVGLLVAHNFTMMVILYQNAWSQINYTRRDLQQDFIQSAVLLALLRVSLLITSGGT